MPLPACGDGILAASLRELCDDGNKDSGDGCSGNCTAIERGFECPEPGEPCTPIEPPEVTSSCGDGDIDAELGETCDDGANDGSYGEGCTADCQLAPFCGDAIVDLEFGEECDDGVNDGSYGGCATNCSRFAPYCGDGVVDDGEECDDGLNLGGWGACTPACELGPRCGDGALQEEWGELCDDGNNLSGDGCSATCHDDDPCGNSIVNLGEECDDGVNNGGYGECAPGCVFGPHCGDNQRQVPFEDCDDGNNVSGDGCNASCKLDDPIYE